MEEHHRIQLKNKLEKFLNKIQKPISDLFKKTAPCCDFTIKAIPLGRTTICTLQEISITSCPPGYISFQWEELIGGEWVSISDETATTLSLDPGLSEGTHSYRLKGTKIDCTNVSNILEIEVVGPCLAFAAQISENCVGGEIELSSELVPAIEPYDSIPRQWQILNGATWENIPGGITKNITVTTQQGLNTYRVVGNENGCLCVSESLEYIPCNDPIEVLLIPELDTFCAGGEAIIHTDVANTCGGVVTYQWQELINELWENIDPNGTGTSPDLFATDLTEGLHSYRVLVGITGRDACLGISNTQIITVVADPVVTIALIAGNDPQCLGSSNTYEATVTGGSGSITYQWSLQTNFGPWLDQFGEVNPTFVFFGIGEDDYNIRVTIYQDTGCEDVSNTLSVTYQIC